MVRRGVAIGVAVGVGIIGIVAVLFLYSYSQVQFKLNDISFAGIDWASASGTTILNVGVNALLGDYLSAALALIDGIKLDLAFAASNHGFLPVYIPDLTYDLSINGVSVGKGQSHIDMIINPGETKNLPVLQVIQKSSIQPAAASLLETGGIMNIKAGGTANFKVLGLTIPIPFESTKQISITDEIKKRFSSSGTEQVSTGAFTQPISNAYLTIRSSSYSVSEGDMITFSGRLSDVGNNGLTNRLIYIKQDRSLASDPILASGHSDGGGSYSITWASDRTGSLKIYSTSPTSADFSEARSNSITIFVSEMQVSNQPEPELEPSPAGQEPQTAEYHITSLSIHVSPTNVAEGKMVSISGRLTTSTGLAIQSAEISIKDEDLGSGDDLIITLYTDSNGEYSYDWQSRAYDPFDNVVEVYAVHEATSNTSSSRSEQVNVTVT